MSVTLNGRLFIKIFEARRLYNADGWFSGKSDPYVCISLDSDEMVSTSSIDDECDPKWDEEFHIDVSGEHYNLFLDVYDYDPLDFDEHLGRVAIPLIELKKGKIKGTKSLTTKSGDEAQGTLTIAVKYRSMEKMRSKSWHLADNPSFPPRGACHVTLYQDAHTAAGEHDSPPAVKTDIPYKYVKTIHTHKKKKKKKKKKIKKQSELIPEDFVPKNAWEEIYDSIKHAQHFIYITGWSVDTTITLLRRQPDDEDGFLTIGELLKKKGEEGVTVRMLIWNEATSGDSTVGGATVGGENGLMATHDEKTVKYFASTEVKCHGVYRKGHTGSEYLWSHHQKTIILDGPAGNGKRSAIAYVGGLDLCDGRWDTPGHTLFRSLQKEHAQDFHNMYSDITRELGPREPWHDIHSKLEGPVAFDVMSNFEQRWKTQVGTPEELFDIDSAENFVDAKFHNDHTYINSDSDSEDDDYNSDDAEEAEESVPKGKWRVQILRSITSDSDNTVEGKDNSIQRGYINAIHNAKRFIYIENQYFMGSSFAWGSEKDAGCDNRIPFEIATKITNRIAKGKPFSVYVVVPMFPEGDPLSNAVQEMLHWQWMTIEMMYTIIAKAIKEHDLEDAKPTDYLNFYCLGNRENADGDEALNPDKPVEVGTYSESARDKRRFMVYVHAKMMIVDDEFVVVGSANINERSMAGDRDTEIAMAAYEDGHVYTEQPSGSVHHFRMSLWGEHLGSCYPFFLNPESAETAQAVRKHALGNWEEYTGDDIVEMRGHLLPYPCIVADDGSITPLVECFPDTKASVKGVSAVMVPNMITQ